MDTRDVVFDEKIFPVLNKQQKLGEKRQLDPSYLLDTVTSGDSLRSNDTITTAPPPVMETIVDSMRWTQEPVLRRSTRMTKPIDRLAMMATSNDDGGVPTTNELINQSSGDDGIAIPMTYREDAMASPDREEWIKAQRAAGKSIQDHDTWDLVSIPPDN